MAVSAKHLVIALWIGWAAYWTYRSRGNKKTVYRPQGLWYLWVFLAAIVLGPAAAHAGVNWNRRVMPDSQAVKALGVMLCIAGLAFAIWARRVLGTNWSGQPTLKEGHELIIAGPYRYVRHPIYTGLLLAMLGTALVWGRLGQFIILAVLFISLWIKSRIEEKLMLRQFANAYVEYRWRTKALIPWVF